MPLEIRELIIKVTVETEAQDSKRGLTQQELYGIKNEIIQECLEKLTEKMYALKER